VGPDATLTVETPALTVEDTLTALRSGVLAGHGSTSPGRRASSEMPIPSVEHRRLRAAGEGQADDTDALQSALDACAGEGGTVTVQSGTYVTGTLRIGSHTELSLAAGATRQVQLHLTAARHRENNLEMPVEAP
jgi:polygalacturonase